MASCQLNSTESDRIEERHSTILPPRLNMENSRLHQPMECKRKSCRCHKSKPLLEYNELKSCHLELGMESPIGLSLPKPSGYNDVRADYR
jgi:hypothetical protein